MLELLRGTMPAKKAPRAASTPNCWVTSNSPTSRTTVTRKVACEVSWLFSSTMRATRVRAISRITQASTQAKATMDAMIGASHQVR
ncbi:MAG: hypothetical protein M3171_06380 [Actinomycetota bacterium]|nr:hypothetical protein [Actinomycetota bacterium]